MNLSTTTTATTTPEANEIVPSGKSTVEELVGDEAVTPLGDLGAVGPKAGANGVPEFVVVTYRNEAFRGNGEVGDVCWG